MRVRTGFSWLRIGNSGEVLQTRNKDSISRAVGNFVDYLGDYQLLRDCAPCSSFLRSEMNRKATRLRDTATKT
jgi:hypothetical protein